MKKTRMIIIVACIMALGLVFTGCSCSKNSSSTNSTSSQSSSNSSANSSSKDANGTNATNGTDKTRSGDAQATANNGGSQDNGNAGTTKGTGIVGTFKYTDAEVPELTSTYTFNQDGTGEYDLCGEKLALTYKTNGNILSITFAGQSIPMDVEYSVNADALTIKDVTGADLVYKRV